MEKNPLTETVYKPTETNKLQLLKPEMTSENTFFLYFSAFTGNLIAFTCGVAFGWTSPVIPKLKEADSSFGRPIDAIEESWIASLLSLGAAIGPLIAGKLADKIGRKSTLLFLCFPIGTAFLLKAITAKIYVLYAARVVLGLGVGSVFAVLPIYLGEIAQDHNRGFLGCLMGVFIASGLLFAFIIGPFLTVQVFCLVCLLPLGLFLVLFSVFIPESPVFLAISRKREEAISCLAKLRGHKDVQKELAEILANIQTGGENGNISDLFLLANLRKGLIISLGLITIQQFSGINVVLSFMQTIFQATGSGLAPEISTILVGTIQILSTVLTSVIVDRLGRRILLITSTIFCSLSLVSLGSYFYMKQEWDVSHISWLPICSLVMYIIVFNLGLGPLPWAIMGELFPSHVKSIASTLTAFICFLTSFLITLFFPYLVVMAGMAQSFGIFGVFCILGAIFVYFVLPETKGKSLQEIQKILSGFPKK